MFSTADWLLRLKRTYIGNATATRDMRIQLRGSRAAVLFTLYLFVMGGVLLLFYNSSMGGYAAESLATAQSRLQEFYYETLVSLGIVITIAAPSMGAFAIVTEKQRRSLDLVFSAPTEPKYYLVGKLIGSFRYVWLLLVLSLPICAVSVTLGGATWGQLFLTFLQFSFYGLVCASFGLLLSTLCSKVLPAIIWTYLAVGCYFIVTFLLLGVTSGFSGSPFTQVNPFGSLNPIAFPFAADQTWPVFGHEVPTWILSIVLQLCIVKFLILAAGSLIAPGNSKEIRGLRVHGLIYIGALAFLVGFSMDPALRTMLPYTTTSTSVTVKTALQIFHGRSVFILLFVLGMIIVPYLSSFGFNDLRRHRPNGFFNIRHILSGRPSGHLPYLLLLFATCVAAYAWGVASAPTAMAFRRFGGPTTVSSIEVLDPFSTSFLMFVLLALDIWLIAFLLGWFSVSRVPLLSRGRTISLFFFVLALILPTALFAIVDGGSVETASGIWAVNPLTSTFCGVEVAGIAGLHSLALLCLCVILALATIPNVAKQSARILEKPTEAPQ
ncbi:MAG: ABC transporter permease [Armatimonadetes bacterium]|nr:ABC transporter permease [Armatimonadota bacterium]